MKVVITYGKRTGWYKWSAKTKSWHAENTSEEGKEILRSVCERLEIEKTLGV